MEVPLDRGIRYSILPALSIDGYLTVHVVEGSIDSAEFYDFVVNDVVNLNFELLFILLIYVYLPVAMYESLSQSSECYAGRQLLNA